MRQFVLFGLLVFGVLLGYLLLRPTDVSPVAFVPPPNPGMTGSFAPNELLRTAQHLGVGMGQGPEDVAKGPDGFFYTGLQDGRIVRFREEGGAVENFINTGGRPLGLHFDANGNLIVADAFRGVLSIDPNKRIALLTDAAEGQRLVFPNDLDIAPDGVIWFSNSSQRFDQHHYLLDFLETRATGSLLSYDPRNGKTSVEIRGLMWPNGVAVGPGGAYVLVNETIASRITRVWLRGPKSGRAELFLTLPAYPDNISFNGRDLFWVALVSPRSQALERTWPTPSLRKVLMPIAKAIIGVRASKTYSWIIGVGTDGHVLHNYQDSSGRAGAVTSVNEFDGRLYLGSISTSFVSRWSPK